MAGFGAFGKIPALGDFFRIEVTRGFSEPWDLWLQEGMLAARGSLGARWQSCYMSAPIWRFCLSAGLAGPDTVLGVVMPSVDRVGREFPLTLATSLPGAPPAIATHCAARAAYEALEAIALDALDESMRREDLAERLAKVPVPVPARGGQMHRGPGLLTLAAAPDMSAVPALAAELATPGFQAPSIWSTSALCGARMMIAERMPNAAQISALFDLEAPVWRTVTYEEAPA